MFSNQVIKISLAIMLLSIIAPRALAADTEALAKKVLCHTCLAKIYVAQGQDPEAIKEYNELLRLTPDDAAAHFDLGNVYYRAEKHDLAGAQYKAAAKLKPTIAQYQLGLGNAYMCTKNFSGAVQAYTRACTLGGKYQKQLQVAQQYEAQQKLLDQYKNKLKQKEDATQ